MERRRENKMDGRKIMSHRPHCTADGYLCKMKIMPHMICSVANASRRLNYDKWSREETNLKVLTTDGNNLRSFDDESSFS